MAALSMGKKRPAEKNAEALSTLKVRKVDAQTVNLVATYRDLSVEKLFMEEDVRAFWNELLKTEQRKRDGGR